MRELVQKIIIGAVLIIIGVLCFYAGASMDNVQWLNAFAGLFVGIGIGIIFIF